LGSDTLAINSSNFETEVATSDKPVLLDFTASWCGPCQRLAPVIDSLARKYEGKAKIAKVDVDENQDLAEKFGINSVPTILFFKGGEVVDKVQGYNPESVFTQILDGHVGG
jgi:thioredoxin 1